MCATKITQKCEKYFKMITKHDHECLSLTRTKQKKRDSIYLYLRIQIRFVSGTKKIFHDKIELNHFSCTREKKTQKKTTKTRKRFQGQDVRKLFLSKCSFIFLLFSGAKVKLGRKEFISV